ncbi:hypothetical protein ACP70R_015137 [Stipagrostis hirtigluma subsp. patula]
MAPPPPPHHPPALPDELVEEILLRFPSADPASLVRAALISTRWCRVVASPGFRRRFRARHRAPPLLGFVGNTPEGIGVASFIPLTSFRPRRADCVRYHARDCRHGRVLLSWVALGDVLPEATLTVWDPITDEQRHVPLPPRHQHTHDWTAAILCASTAIGTCDHLDCHSGPFIVVFVGINTIEMFTQVYSSESGAWSEAISAQHPGDYLDMAMPVALVGNALYFLLLKGTTILRCDLATRELSVIHLPHRFPYGPHAVLMTMEDGKLGVAAVDSSRTLCLWSMEVDAKGDTECALIKVIELETLLPACALSVRPCVLAFADSTGVVFLGTSDGIFTMDLKSRRVTNVSKDREFLCGVFPYMSFYTPGMLRLSWTDGVLKTGLNLGWASKLS